MRSAVDFPVPDIPVIRTFAMAPTYVGARRPSTNLAGNDCPGTADAPMNGSLTRATPVRDPLPRTTLGITAAMWTALIVVGVAASRFIQPGAGALATLAAVTWHFGL